MHHASFSSISSTSSSRCMCISVSAYKYKQHTKSLCYVQYSCFSYCVFQSLWSVLIIRWNDFCKDILYDVNSLCKALDPKMCVCRPQVTDKCSPALTTISTAGEREFLKEAAHWRERGGCGPASLYCVKLSDAWWYKIYWQNKERNRNCDENRVESNSHF